MANQIRPLARLFRGMADLIDRDHASRTRYEGIAKAARVVAARATAQELQVLLSVADRPRPATLARQPDSNGWALVNHGMLGA